MVKRVFPFMGCSTLSLSDVYVRLQALTSSSLGMEKRQPTSWHVARRREPFRRQGKQIGTDIMTVEFGWPIGMPVCRPLGHALYEVRTSLSGNRIARVTFYIDKRSRMVLLHGFIKKTRKTPAEDLNLAAANKSKHERGLK
jgi:phage-related protein